MIQDACAPHNDLEDISSLAINVKWTGRSCRKKSLPFDSVGKSSQNHETAPWIRLIWLIRTGPWTTGTRQFQCSPKRRPEFSSWRWFSWGCPSVDSLRSSSSAVGNFGSHGTCRFCLWSSYTCCCSSRAHSTTWPVSTSSPSVAGSSPFSTAFRTCSSMCRTFWLSSNVTWPSAIHQLINSWPRNGLWSLCWPFTDWLHWPFA